MDGRLVAVLAVLFVGLLITGLIALTTWMIKKHGWND